MPLRINLKPLGAASDATIMLDGVELGYRGEDEKIVRLPLPPLSLRVDFGEHIAIVGYNGVGKSTLIRTLIGDIEPPAGTASIGRELRLGAFTQEHENLPRSCSPLMHFRTLAKLEMEAAKSLLIRFGLTLQQVSQPIALLNPGARARLLLAIFSMRQVNLLVLDEPTNHLDQEAVVEIMATLKTYEGTVILVSHDRELLSSVPMTRILSLGPQGLVELDRLDDFLDVTLEAVHPVVKLAFHGVA